jgi:uncharacterized membrane protein
MTKKREFATSMTALMFLVIGATGVMMYFHILDKYTKQMHEILGLVFVAAVLAHVFVHYKSMKQYFSKKIFLIISVLTLVTVSVFVLNAPEGKSSKKILAEGVFNSNIEKSFVLFADNADLAKTRLTQAGLKIQGLETIDQIAKENKTSPFRVVQVISAK